MPRLRVRRRARCRAQNRRVRVFAVDWSGARVGAAARIVVAEADPGGHLVDLRRGLDRAAAIGHLVRAAERGPVVAGLDFAFGLPAWYAAAVGARTGPDLWKIVADRGEEWLATIRAPFWGRYPQLTRPDQEHWRRTDAEQPVRPKSVFQVGGAGTVGTGSLRGMPYLLTLRAAGFAIWPFDRADAPVVVEIYPRLFTGPLNKRSAAARHAAVDRLPSRLRATAAASEDALDAALSAVGLAARVDDLLGRPPLGPPFDVEGAILA